MDNIKIGSIVTCNALGAVYNNLDADHLIGLIYDLRWVGGQRYHVATVAFEYDTRTREISTEFLTPIGEIEPAEYTALNYRPGTRLKLREDYIVDHIELTPKPFQLGKDTSFYKVFTIVAPDNNMLKYMDRKLADYIDSNFKEENNMCMSKAKDTRIPTNPFYNPIKKVIFNDPATIVFWKDGTKTIVKCQEGVTFDPEKGLAMAISRHYLCDICGLERYDGVFKRYVPKEMKK